MIAREWRGQVRTEQLEGYVDYVRATGVDEYLRTPGNRTGYILTRDLGDGLSELVALSVWDSYDDFDRFAGNDVDQMVLYPEDSDYLVATPTLTHYRVTDPTHHDTTGATS